MTSFLSALRQLDEGRHRAEFYRSWRVGMAAGFTVVKSLETMGPRESKGTEQMRLWLLEGSRRGKSVSELVRAGPARFDSFERALLVLGDESGSLEKSLGLLADFYTRKHRLMLWVKKKMAYPLFTGLFATVIAPLKLLVIGATGAYVTTVGAGLALWIVAGGAVVAFAANHYGRQPAFVRARLARSLATAIEAGLPLGRSLRLAADASGDPELRAFVERFGEREINAQPLAVTLASCPHLTPDFIGVLETAERTGDFTTTMTRLAELYEDGFR